jgi:hypothetical protein
MMVVLATTGTGTQINTAYIEWLNATFRASLAPLARLSRCVLHRPALLSAAMYLVGTSYRCCWPQESLHLAQQALAASGQERTPAMAAGLTDQCWPLHELLANRILPALWVAPKRRGRWMSGPGLPGTPAGHREQRCYASAANSRGPTWSAILATSGPLILGSLALEPPGRQGEDQNAVLSVSQGGTGWESWEPAHRAAIRPSAVEHE